VEKAFIIIIAATLKRNGGEWNGLQAAWPGLIENSQ